jgi:hypothetical protein
MNMMLMTAALLLPADAPKGKPLSARPTAMVMTVKGEVTAQGRLKKRSVQEGDYLLPGETITIPANAEVEMVFLVKGERRRLKPGARATLTRDGCDPDDVAELLGPAKLPRKNLTKVREVEVGEGGGVGVVRGGKPPTEARIMPLFGTFVMTDQPAFAWPRSTRRRAMSSS